MSEASPICRGKNLTLETVLAFVNAMPLTPMKKAEFHAVTESKLKGWTQTHSQIARQLALYFEKEGICYPRFSQRVTYTDILCYMVNWAKHYFVPNIYTPSLKIEGYRITNIYAYLKNCVKNGVCSYNDACLQMFGVELNNTDKVRVYINNFTDLIISDDLMFVNDHLADTSIPEIYPNNIGLSAEDYFNYFTIGLHQKADSLQQIFYGAPGTGKSHAINELTAGKDVIRTTFHPDTDYSTFVGAYKPTTKSVPVTTVIGTNAVPVIYNGKKMMEDKIVYEYVSQAFLQAYVAAWRKFAPQEVLDIATGTGDLAIMNAQRNHPRRIVGADISEGMMDVARKKVAKAGLSDIITFQREDCTHMSFADNSFDAVTSSYGVRNFSDLDAGLREMCRVLRPGGHLLIVELSTPVRFPMKQLFGIYAHVVMPLMGRLISHDDSAYTYLPMSMEAFPQAEEMEQILHKNGFSSVQWKRFCGGISTMYLATK